jgi:Fe2+ or Zn2+ uptake regulation protein
VDDIELFEDINLSEQNVDTNGYTLESYEIVFNGICPECKKNMRAAQ